MITHRFMEDRDHETLARSLSEDEHHLTTQPEFFMEPGTVCSVYEDDAGVVMFVRGRPYINEGNQLLKLDIQFVKNSDLKRNLKTMMTGFPALAELARQNGFRAIFFHSLFAPLKAFCIKRLGFTEVFDNWLAKVYNEDIS